MTARLIDALARRAPRERLLLALLAFAVLPAALWLALLDPLAARRAEARAALAETRALADWVAARRAEIAALAVPGEAGPRPPIGLSALEQSLIEAGLRAAVSDLANRDGGGIELRFETVNFRALMAWLGRADPGWGYDIAALRLSARDAPGLVAAELRLVPQ